MKMKSNFLFATVALVLSQFACNFGANIAGGTPQPQASAGGAPIPAPAQSLSGDPTAIVVNAIQILPTLSYRKKEWFTDSKGNPPDLNKPPMLVAEFTPPSNSHVTFRDVEYITFNGNFYSRQIGGQWELSAPSSSPQNAAAKVADMLTQALQSKSITIQAAGSDTVNGVATQIFSISGSIDMSGTPFKIAGKVWIGNNGRMVKMEIANPSNKQVFDLSFYEYDPSIKIEAPIP